MASVNIKQMSEIYILWGIAEHLNNFLQWDNTGAQMQDSTCGIRVWHQNNILCMTGLEKSQ